jgi:hypothetical protein
MMHRLYSYAMNKPARGSLLSIEHLADKEILGLLKLARRMNPLKARPLLRNKRIVLLFYEASTRTRSSFEFAAKSLGAITTLVQSSGSSIEKGESLLDTGYTLRAVGADAIVIRHPAAGAPHLMAKHLDIPVINAGDCNHPEAQEIVQGTAGRDHWRYLSQPRDPLELPFIEQVRGEDHALRSTRVCARGVGNACARPAGHAAR